MRVCDGDVDRSVVHHQLVQSYINVSSYQQHQHTESDTAPLRAQSSLGGIQAQEDC